MLSVHYRQPINFSDTLITQAKQGFDRIINGYQNLKYRLNHAIDSKANQAYLERLKAIKENLIRR